LLGGTVYVCNGPLLAEPIHLVAATALSDALVVLLGCIFILTVVGIGDTSYGSMIRVVFRIRISRSLSVIVGFGGLAHVHHNELFLRKLLCLRQYELSFKAAAVILIWNSLGREDSWNLSIIWFCFVVLRIVSGACRAKLVAS